MAINSPAPTSSPVIYSMLPHALQSSLQPLALVRRSLSDYGLRSRRRVSSLGISRNCDDAGDTVVASRDDERAAVASSSSSSSSSSSTADDSAEVPGIGWKFARHGSHVLEASLAESQTPDVQSQAFSRQLYLDSVAYLIQGLPSNLTQQEKLQLKNALPEPLLRGTSPSENIAPARKKPNPSILHRGLAATVVAVCVLLRLALPYIKVFIAGVYSYDRTHHVSQRAFAFGITAADTLGRWSVALASTAMTNESVLGAVTYWADGIRGGLDEGFGEGLKVIDNDNQP